MANINIPVVFANDQILDRFASAITGDDNDILLAIEKVINERLGEPSYETGVWVTQPHIVKAMKK